MVDTLSSAPVDTSVSPYQPDPQLIQARNAFAQKIGVLPTQVEIKVGRDDPDHPIGQRSYARRIRPMGMMAGEDTQELIFVVHNLPGIDLEEKRVKDEVRAKLADLKPLADYAQMMPQEQLAVELKKKIIEATEGTDFATRTKLLEWPGFDPKIISNGWEVGDYAGQNIRDNAYGITLNLHFPSAKGESDTLTIERFKELTEGRLAGIKEIMTDRVIKYATENMKERGLNEQEKQQVQAQAQSEGKNPDEAIAQMLETKIKLAETKVREDMAKLIISLNIDHNNLVITLRSPEQAEAYNKADPNARDGYEGPPNDELRNTNPLTSRIVALATQETAATETTPARSAQLAKALMRSILFDMDKNLAPDVIRLIGRQDWKAAFIKDAMLRIIPKHPEKADALKAIIESELFKNHGYWHNTPGNPGVAKPEPKLNRIADGTLEVAFNLRQDKDPEKNQLLQVVKGLATLAPAINQENGEATSTYAELVANQAAQKAAGMGGIAPSMN